MSKLKPCPFCGGDAIVSKHEFLGDSHPSFGIVCRKCRAKTDQFLNSEEEAVAAWNQRKEEQS